MPKMSKQARAREFNAASRQIIKERDLYQCIFAIWNIIWRMSPGTDSSC